MLYRSCFTAFCFLTVWLSVLAQDAAKPDLIKMVRASMKFSGVHLDIGIGEDRTGLTAYHTLADPEIRKTWNVSEEDYQKLQAAFTNPTNAQKPHPAAAAEKTEYDAAQKEYGEMVQAAKNNGTFQNADAATLKRVKELHNQMLTITSKWQARALNETLTPELRKKTQEYELALTVKPFGVSPTALEILGLSEEQKSRIDRIAKTMEPELQSNLIEMSGIVEKLMEKTFDRLEQEHKTITDPQVFQDKMKAATLQTVRSDTDIKEMLAGVRNKNQEFTARYKFQLYDVLTDEQMQRLQALADNPPDYIKATRERLHKVNEGFSDKEEEFSLDNLWKPGDPIPEAYKEHRKNRKQFPQAEETPTTP